MRFRLTILAALAAFSMLAADAPKQQTATPPPISTAKFWRLIANAQALRQQANQTPQAKAADAADEDVKKEQAKLEATCGAGFVLGYQQDTTAENAGDIICLPKPTAPAPSKTSEPPAANKEK